MNPDDDRDWLAGERDRHGDVTARDLELAEAMLVASHFLLWELELAQSED